MIKYGDASSKSMHDKVNDYRVVDMLVDCGWSREEAEAWVSINDEEARNKKIRELMKERKQASNKE